LRLGERWWKRYYHQYFSPWGTNAALKESFCQHSTSGDELCAAIRSGLVKNSTLEELSLYNMSPSDDDGAVSARNAFLFFALTPLSSLIGTLLHRKLKGIICFRLSIEAVNMLKEYFSQ
jgi:hypothetical protein